MKLVSKRFVRVRLSLAVGLVAALVACNGLLGIGPATVESPEDSSVGVDAGMEGGAEPLTCDHYCNVIMNNCTGSNSEYLSSAICLSMCPVFDLGMTIGDTKDNTLGCRIFNANAAATNPEVTCRYAGPLGGGHCGPSNCQAFCGLDVPYCAAPKPVPYAGGDPECETDCAKYPYLVTDAGDTTTESGNTLNCRLWHLETAYTSASYGMFHCPHTAQVSSTCF
jgi:hypothetical protein